MKMIGAKTMNRLLATVLALVMLLTAVPAQAQELEGWSNITVSALWTDASGTTWQYPAVRVPDEMGLTYTWWITLPETALGSQVQLDIVHPDPAYTYWLPDWTLNMFWFEDKDAREVDDLYTYYVGYSYNGTPQVSQQQDCMKVLLSTQQPPFALSATDPTPGIPVAAPGNGMSGEIFGDAEFIVPGDEVIIVPDEPVVPDVPAAPAEAVITVYYQHIGGQTLDVQDVTLGEGTHILWPDSKKVAGYLQVGDETHTVTVYADGWTDVASITFYYDDVYVAPAEATVEVYYYHQDGYELDRETLTLGEGTHRIYPTSSRVGGYELVSDDVVTVYVDSKGQADLASVSFLYRDVYVAPAQAHLTVFVYDEMGNEIAARRNLTLEAGTHTIEAPAGYETEGYELISEAVITVTVYDDGSYTTYGDELAFRYRRYEKEIIAPAEPVVTQAPAQKADVVVRYLDDRGYEIASSQVITLGEGTHVINPDAAHVPQGYTAFAGADSATVTVRNGRANQDTVTFYFLKEEVKPTIHNVTVYYYDSYGNEIAPRETKQLEAGLHYIQADPSRTPAGYTLSGESAFYLTVREDGSLDRAAKDVAFRYEAIPVEPKSAVITIRYVDDYGRTIAGPYTTELTGGQTYRISPDPMVIPEAYDVTNVAPVDVNVTMDGLASPSVVSFVAELRRDPVQVPVGEEIRRYGVVNDNRVALRSEPYSTKSNTVIQRLEKDTMVYMLAAEYNTAGEVWTQVIVNGRTGYMKAEFIDMLTPLASQTYASSVGATPVPTFTPVPTPTPTESIVEAITPVPPPTATPYAGYAVVQQATSLRTGVGMNEWSLAYLETDTLVLVTQQVDNLLSGEPWAMVRTLDNLTGYVPMSALWQISEQEAAWRMQLWQQQNATASPTQAVVSTAQPEQLQGYALTLTYNAPLRSMPSEYSAIMTNLDYNAVVYVTGQTYTDGVTWHNVAVDGLSGYIRSDLTRFMTAQEESLYLDSLLGDVLPQITPTSNPYDLNGLSSFGYVTKNNVNFRSGASTSAKAIGSLNMYAMATVLGTQRADGYNWYMVNYNGVTGYVRGDCFTQMTLSEFGDFYGSDKYQQGIRNNSKDSNKNETNTGTGGQISQEDQVLNNQYGTGNSVPEYNFEAFIPVGTVEPIYTATPPATPTLEPLPGYVTQGTPATSQQTANGGNGSDLPLPGESGTVVYPMQDNEGGSGLIWVIVIVLLLLAGGGVFALVQHQRRQRQIALRAAQRRAQQARNAQRPYARQGEYASRTGAYPSQGAYGQTAQQAAPQRPYARPDGTSAPTANGANTTPAPRVGRRTAYQQALAEKQDKEGNE